jgi:hypothetical protein
LASQHSNEKTENTKKRFKIGLLLKCFSIHSVGEFRKISMVLGSFPVLNSPYGQLKQPSKKNNFELKAAVRLHLQCCGAAHRAGHSLSVHDQRPV